MKNVFNVTTVLPHNLLQTNPWNRYNFSTQVFRKRAAQHHYVDAELRYISWPQEANTINTALRFGGWIDQRLQVCSYNKVLA